MLSKSLIQFSVDGQGCVPSLLFDLRPNYGGGNEDNGDLVQKVPCTHCYTQCPQPCSSPPPTHASAGDSWTLTASLGQSPVGSLLLSPGSWCTRFCYALQESISQSYVSGFNGDFLQEHLCHTHTQSLCPCGRPLPTCTSTGDARTQFCLCLSGVPGSWCAGFV